MSTGTTATAATAVTTVTPGSRHDGAHSYTVEVDGPGGVSETIELLEPRAPAPTAPALTHAVVASDRLDLLAARYFGNPLEYWRIADANPGLAPEDALDPGARIVIPKRT